MGEKNPLSIIAENVENLAKGVGKLIERVTNLETDTKEIKSKVEKLEKSNGNQTTE